MIVDLVILEVEFDLIFKFKCIENCGFCCERFEILFRDEDIERIEGLGYNIWEFVDYEKFFYRGDKFLGYVIKKNFVIDVCVFFDLEIKKCKIYNYRLFVCRLYLFVFVKYGERMEIYIKEDLFCFGINYFDGKFVIKDFFMKEYWDIIEEYR